MDIPPSAYPSYPRLSPLLLICPHHLQSIVPGSSASLSNQVNQLRVPRAPWTWGPLDLGPLGLGAPNSTERGRGGARRRASLRERQMLVEEGWRVRSEFDSRQAHRPPLAFAADCACRLPCLLLCGQINPPHSGFWRLSLLACAHLRFAFAFDCACRRPCLCIFPRWASPRRAVASGVSLVWPAPISALCAAAWGRGTDGGRCLSMT